MLTGHRPAARRRSQTRRAARIAVPLAIPVVLGVTLGVVVSVSGKGPVQLADSAFGWQRGGWHHGGGWPATTPTGSATSSATASLSGVPGGSASSSPTTSASPTASAGTGNAAPPANSFDNGPIATSQLGDVATSPVDGTGAAINMNQTAAQAAASMNCTLTVPADPLSAAGLATPWQLGDGCSMANAGTEGAFVEATILAPDGSLQVYNPLVVTQGTQPAVTPKTPTIAAGSSVIIDIGFNGTNLVLTGPGAKQGNCVDAYGQSVIGQVSACNAVNFYKAANAAIARGTLKVPPAGTASDGRPCQTTRDFALVDQDQSDNVVSEYLSTPDGRTAQATAASKAALAGASLLANGSDDALLSDFVLPANGCKPFTAPDATNPGGTSASQALNELSAKVSQKPAIAVVPPNDEMTLVGGNMSIAKTNVYRSLVDQPLLARNTNPVEVAAAYCMNMVNIAQAHNQADMASDASFATPVSSVGDNLATFMGNRLSMSFANLGCGRFGLTDPVNVTTDSSGVATAVSYDTAHQQATMPVSDTRHGHGNRSGVPWQGHGYRYGSDHRGYRRFQDPSGM